MARAVREPVSITGAGVVTPIGQDLDSFWAGLVTGVSGISEIERFPVGDLRVTRGGEVKKLLRVPAAGSADPDWPEGRASRFLVHAAREALETAGLRTDCLPPARIGVVIGTALGGIDAAEHAVRGEGGLRRLAGSLYDGPTRDLARWLGATGPVLAVSTACASGATSLGLGADLLRDGCADVVLAGGVDVLCRFVQRGFNVLRSLTRDLVRPFDRRRSGLLLGEGAGVVVLERRRDAEARGHRAVLGRLLGPRARAVPVNSIKAHLGHTMGAAATLEAIMGLLAFRHGLVPPTLNYGAPDPECDLDYVPDAPRRLRPRVTLSTSLGFGGCNAALVLGAP